MSLVQYLKFFLCCVCPITCCFSQSDSVVFSLQVDTILLQQLRWQDAQKSHHTRQISNKSLRAYNSRSLADVLSLESSFFVKDYGISNISTLSGRGGSAAQSTVLWEGFDLQNPMLGQVDLSLIPTSFVDYVDLQYGGESALFGNSSLGGAIHIGTRPMLDCGWQMKAQMQAGSFENFGQQLQLKYSNKNYSVSLRSQYQSAKNNFPYIDVNAFGQQKPILLQQNAAVEQFGLLHEQHLKLNNQSLGLKIWYQEANRQLPPTLLNNKSEDRQKDISLRTVALWSLVQEQMVWKARTALFVESLRFQNQLINSYSIILSSITEAENKWYLHPLHQLLTGLNFRFSNAVSDGYKQQTQQLRGAIFAAYQYHTKNERLRAHLRLRAEMVDKQLVRPATSIGIIWRFYQSFKAKLQVSNNYRLPTFNDLYWDVLGNPNLKPEYSWNSELSLQLPITINKTSFEANVSLFSNWVNDWILWSPNSAGLWRPENVDKVWARGLEADLDILYRTGQWQLGLTINYAHTKSTRTAGDKPETIGKQLIYIPKNQVNLQFCLQFKSSRFCYQHQLISARFIDKLNLEKLPLYQLGHVQLEHSFSLKKAQLTTFLRLANVFGTNYQIIPMRAMPWQQFELGLRINLNEKPKI